MLPLSASGRGPGGGVSASPPLPPQSRGRGEEEWGADRGQLPTLGWIIADQIRGVDAAEADAAVDDDVRHNLY